jgi:hypothetical protein
VFLVGERKTAVCAPADLRLIYVDEDPGVAERTTASVAFYGTVVCPADGLLVDELDGGVWTGLHHIISANALLIFSSIPSSLFSWYEPHTQSPPLCHLERTWSSIMLCSNLGPLIATSLGF